MRADYRNDEVDELARHDDLLHDLVAVDVRADRSRSARASSSSSSSPRRGGLDPVAELAVDLDDEREPASARAARRRPPARAAPRRRAALERSQTSEPRWGANGKISEAAVAVGEADRALALGLAVEALLEAVGLVDELHHRGDRRVELEVALEVARGLVDGPVGLAQELAGGAGGRALPSRPWPRSPPARPTSCSSASRQRRRGSGGRPRRPSSTQSPPRSGGPRSRRRCGRCRRRSARRSRRG